MLRTYAIFVFFFFCWIDVSGQVLRSTNSNLKKRKNIFGDKCSEYLEIVNKLPADVRFDVRVLDGRIVIIFTSHKDFKELFDKKFDGLAVDIIHKDLYQCGVEDGVLEGHPNKGHLLTPLFKNDLKNRITIDLFGNMLIDYGPLPPYFNADDIECNLLILQKRTLCEYKRISNMHFEAWDLLETGLFRDSVSTSEQDGQSLTFYKELEFTIPFERNKATFSPSEIKPLYDSLRLKEYVVNEVHITAYTSVEGSSEQNRKLQQDRAESISSVLQSFQDHKIKTYINTEENWSQFAKDISGTSFSYLRKFTKEQLRDSILKNEEMLLLLEPILAKQRKGEIKLTLEKKVMFDENDRDKITEYFESSLAETNLKQALSIQNLIFEKIKNEELPEDFLNGLTIPKSSEYGPLFNNLVLYNWERQNYDLLRTIREFELLETFIPGNPQIKFNIAALKIKAWAEGPTYDINREVLAMSIKDLGQSDIPRELLNRLNINYNILLGQYLLYEKDFIGKKKAIHNILYYYRQVRLNDSDLHRLAKYLAFNSEFKAAIEVLEARVINDDVSEDVLFYFLELWFSHQDSRLSFEVNDMIEKAVKRNKERFCLLFLPKSMGGYTFQLKEDPLLKDVYCVTCEW